ERWAVIEGVMGMFDGMSGTAGFGSTADVAKLLQAPIILIVDASSMSRSVAALVHGFNTYDPAVNLQGVILNRVKSSAQEKILREALNEIQIPVLGVLPKEAALHLPERHLGLVPVGEGGLLEGFIDTLSQLVSKHIDLEQVERIMLGAPDLDESFLVPRSSQPKVQENKFRLGLALDEAFLFYYQDALDLAKRMNFIVVPFSPLHDMTLPPD
ncbi:MAG TPA: cobyrinate a,c-diamide synthase, partial [Desulfosporosinus sp.]|nr:cobyrinate a,c-diamide synthase [Desulfosporosinus sp.]